jgi:post-segregation antitoxin (ccd killing protein)
MGTKGNVVLYLDKDLVEKSKSLGFNLSKTFENHLKQLMTQFSTCNSWNNSNSTIKNVNWCGRRDLNPGSQAWKACVLNQLDDDRYLDTSLNRKQQNKSIQPRAEGAIINTLIAIKANEIQEGTSRQINWKLKDLARNADIFNPKAVKQYTKAKRNYTQPKTFIS